MPQVSVVHRVCVVCGVEFSFERKHGGPPKMCSERCRYERRLALGRGFYGRQSPEKRRRQLKRNRVQRYGLSVDQWNDLLASQGACCAACGSSHPGTNWHTDHCHVSGVVRGILCHSCNTALGLLKDSPERVSALGRYLAAVA